VEKKEPEDRHQADRRFKAVCLVAKGFHAGAGGLWPWLGGAVDHSEDVHGKGACGGVHGCPFRNEVEGV